MSTISLLFTKALYWSSSADLSQDLIRSCLGRRQFQLVPGLQDPLSLSNYLNLFLSNEHPCIANAEKLLPFYLIRDWRRWLCNSVSNHKYLITNLINLITSTNENSQTIAKNQWGKKRKACELPAIQNRRQPNWGKEGNMVWVMASFKYASLSLFYFSLEKNLRNWWIANPS